MIVEACDCGLAPDWVCRCSEPPSSRSILAAAVSATSTEPGVAEEAEGVGRIPPDASVGRDTDEGRTDLASRSLDVPGSVGAAVSPEPGSAKGRPAGFDPADPGSSPGPGAAVSPTSEEAAAAEVREALCDPWDWEPMRYSAQTNKALVALGVLVAALRDARRERDNNLKWRERYRDQCLVTGEKLTRAERERDQARDALRYIADADHPMRLTLDGCRKRARAALGGAAEETGGGAA